MRYSKSGYATIAALVLSACSGGSDGGTNTTPTPPNPGTPPASATVTAGSNSDTFSPSDVRVAAGGVVTWSFGARAHSVVFASAAGAPSAIGGTSDAQVSRTFNTEGTFPYECTLHSGMRGRVLVGSTAGGTSEPGY